MARLTNLDPHGKPEYWWAFFVELFDQLEIPTEFGGVEIIQVIRARADDALSDEEFEKLRVSIVESAPSPLTPINLRDRDYYLHELFYYALNIGEILDRDADSIPQAIGEIGEMIEPSLKGLGKRFSDYEPVWAKYFGSIFRTVS